MKIMRNTFVKLCILFSALFVVSCGPSRHAVQVEMRYPSKSGLELAGKVVSVVYLTGEDKTQASLSRSLAEGFVLALKLDYSHELASINLYNMERQEKASYSSRDTLVNILMDTGADMVLLIDSNTSLKVDESFSVPTRVPFSVAIYSYDAMNPDDSVITFSGSNVIEPDKYDDISSKAVEAGKLMANPFKSQWKNEQYSIAYFDSDKWYDALYKADSYYWKEAMDVWMSLLSSKDVLKRACAEYNIAVACFMLGDYSLAEEWLDRSDKENMIPTLSEPLRKRINARLK